MSDRDLFVDSSGATIATPTLGHTAYSCNQCQREWVHGQEHCRCGSVVFDMKYVAPTLLERVGNRIMGVATPEKVKVRSLTPDDVAVFEAAAAAGRAYAAALQAADQRARLIVNSDRVSAAMVYLQGRLDSVAGMVGDYAPSTLTAQALPALSLANLIDQQIREHAEEVNAS